MLKTTNKLTGVIFLLIAVVLVVFKSQYLALPYYWDELGVYANGAIHLAQHHISILPDALPTDISRGHPLLSYAMFAVPYRLFGLSPVVGHLTSLAFALFLLFAIARFCLRFYNAWAAGLAMIFLAVQPLFIAQSGLVLPEILLAIAMILGLHSFLRGNYWAFALWGSVGIMIKETAIVLPAVVLFVEIISWLRGTAPMGKRFRWILFLVPLLAYGSFLLIQKQVNGWYFFPLHTGLIDLSWSSIQEKLSLSTDFLFVKQGRQVLSIAILGSIFLAMLWVAFRHKRIPLQGIMRLNKVDFTLGVFLLAFLSFTVINFYMDRYLVSALVIVCILFARIVTLLPRDLVPIKVLVVLSAFWAMQYVMPGKFNYDVDLSYVEEIRVLQQEVTWLESNEYRDSTMYCGFPAYYALTNEQAGYLKGGSFSHLTTDPQKILSVPGSLFLAMDGGGWNVGADLSTLKKLQGIERGHTMIGLYRVP